MNFQRTSKIR